MKAATIPEIKLHIALVVAIRASINKGWTFTHPASGEQRDKKTAAKLKQMGVTAGFPDLIFFGPEEEVYFLELKSADGRLSKTQEEIRSRLMRSGFNYHVTNSVSDALEQLYDLGIVRARVSA